MSTLNIRGADQCHYDAVALGEVMLRIDPGDVPTARARTARISHGGGETNVAEGLSACFGLRTTIVTALVDDGIGRNIENQLRESGVDTSHIVVLGTRRGSASAGRADLRKSSSSFPTSRSLRRRTTTSSSSARTRRVSGDTIDRPSVVLLPYGTINAQSPGGASASIVPICLEMLIAKSTSRPLSIKLGCWVV